jgi:hypothetical protein
MHAHAHIHTHTYPVYSKVNDKINGYVMLCAEAVYAQTAWHTDI